jgi:MYXO-CTERM domain-containing protein
VRTSRQPSTPASGARAGIGFGAAGLGGITLRRDCQRSPTRSS